MYTTAIKKILSLLTLDERKRALKLMVMIMVMAFLDVLGVASILPFIAVLANPDLVHTNELLNVLFNVSRQIGIETSKQFLFVLGSMYFFLLSVSLFFKALTNYQLLRFALMREFSIGKRLVESYFHQPYSWFLTRHSADLGKTILSEVGIVIGSGLIPFLTLVAQSTVVLVLLIFLMIVDTLLALSVGAVLGLTYLVYYLPWPAGFKAWVWRVKMLIKNVFPL